MPSSQTLPQSVWPSKALPAPATSAVLAQISSFLDKLGYDKTVKALLKEAKNNDITVDINAWPGDLKGQHPAGQSLGDLYVDILLQDVASDDESASEDSSDSSSSEGDDSESDEESPAATEAKSAKSSKALATPQGMKRKRDTSDASDSSESSSDSDSSEDEVPAAKKAKKAESSASDASSSDDSSSEDSSSEGSSSDGESAASASSSSDSDSSSDSESESESEEEAPKVKSSVKNTAKKVVKADKISKKDAQRNDSISAASSETLAGSPQPNNQAESMHPARQIRMQPESGNVTPTIGSHKKINQPFSRIPKDTAVDPRFASNAYVPYDYANRAHQDLVVTKGKGFTKEKNKKKRGSYRGGVIDITPKGIKFDD